ncbi:hypothetical protein D3C81_2231730 [compost metagenome]
MFTVLRFEYALLVHHRILGNIFHLRQHLLHRFETFTLFAFITQLNILQHLDRIELDPFDQIDKHIVTLFFILGERIFLVVTA